MRTSFEDLHQRRIIHLGGRFDAEGAQLVAQELKAALSAGARLIEVDMSGVDYLSSAGMRVLLDYYKQLAHLKGGLYLTAVSERVSHVLEINGLYDILNPPKAGHEAQAGAGARIISLDGWTLEHFCLEPEAALAVRAIGLPCSDLRATGAPLLQTVAFPPSSFSIGTGALGYDAAACADVAGVFIAAGGFAAFKPAGGIHPPDFVAYAEAYIPELYVAAAEVFTGAFSGLASFERGSRSPNLAELLKAVLSLGSACDVQTDRRGIVLAAECELQAEGMMVSRTLLAAGSMALPPDCHLHAVLFPYAPLRLGNVKRKDTISALFDACPLDLVHLGQPEACARFSVPRGVVWFAPLAK